MATHEMARATGSLIEIAESTLAASHAKEEVMSSE